MANTKPNTANAATCRTCFFVISATVRGRNGKERNATICGIRPPTASNKFPETFGCGRCAYWTNADTQAQPFRDCAPEYPPMVCPTQTQGVSHV